MKCPLVCNDFFNFLEENLFSREIKKRLLDRKMSILGLDDLNTVVSGVSGGERSSCGGDNLLFLLLIG